jgi:hypothetical protein
LLDLPIEAVAPAWFVQWAQQQQELQQQQFNFLHDKISNSTAHNPEDELRPPRVVGGLNIPDQFPRTVADILALRPGPLLTQIENYYALPHQGAINIRKRRVIRAYGLGLLITIT